MNGSGAQRRVNDSAGQLDLRVILVGRTGLDAALRLDPGIELSRAGTPMEAIGELSSPTGSDGPQNAVVIVGAEVQKELAAAGASRVAEFIGGLRTVDPAVRVLRMAQNGSNVGADLFDGELQSGVGAAAVRGLVRTPPAKVSVIGEPAPGARADADLEEMLAGSLRTDPEAPGGGRQAAERTGSERSTGDTVVLSMALRGQDPAPGCVALIRERTGDTTLEFIAGDAGDASCAPVLWEKTCFGHLRSARTPPGVLVPHARWMGAWLRLRDQQAQLREAAFTDPLTGAWNRRYFDRFLASVLEGAREARRSITVMVFDIDDFKKYNDKYGHDAGDEILREAVRLMRSVIRPSDRVCRIGGDEFGVIFNEPEGPRQEGSRPPTDVFGLAQRFQQQITGHRFPKLADLAPGTLTISGGLATFPWDGTTPEQLVTRADQLALASKRQGKNAITVGPGALRGGR